MERYCHAVEADRLPVRKASNARTGVHASTQHAHTLRRGEVSARAPRGVISVGMGYDGTIDRLPWIDVEIAGRAVEAAVGTGQEGHVSKIRGGCPYLPS